MPASDSLEASALDLYFLNTNDSNVGDATGLRGSTSAGSFYISLHTANPGDAGDQTTSEATYTGYQRIAVARSGAGWSRTTNTISNAATVGSASWACTGGTDAITYFGIGTASSGAGRLLWYGALTASLAVSNGITPTFAAGALTVSND